MRAQRAFLAVLDEYALDDFRTHRPELVALLDASRAGRAREADAG
jgi:hypothetical protein